MRTPTPWAQSDSVPTLVFRDNLGMIVQSQPVAQFKHADDARQAVKAVNSAEALSNLVDALIECRSFEVEFGCAEQGPLVLALEALNRPVPPELQAWFDQGMDMEEP
ncbi:MAG: hypothetical protein GY873_08605 [Bosea sp.]|uniref:hypothetical protein n=1 Tax=Bosea sp. (in: a-proteobacteria) TaxID=1871050 RepID=UPI00238FDC6C|nr:hypothetical protein [Bosea sp. (in: a-proteobacteria)]MCP4734239.1 hypothetical protein [Bosea sp. (in: a-proteobacteria)]